LRRSLTLASLAGTIALLAGCGSSTTSTSTSASSGATATKAAASSPYSHYGTSSPAAATAAATTASAPAATGVQITVKRAKLGEIVAAGPRRLTVYLFEADSGGASACTGACASAWPPVTTAAAPSAGAGASASALGTITRADGTKQVTYGGHPLYFFAQDKDQGDAYGQGVKSFGAAWYTLKPSGSKLDNS
jgi:predicted lipoprotein with Yx(FWY)xxD motif